MACFLNYEYSDDDVSLKCLDGTVLLKDFNPDGSSNPDIADYTPDNGAMVFIAEFDAATTGQTGYELGITDGTPEETRFVKDINEGQDESLCEIDRQIQVIVIRGSAI